MSEPRDPTALRLTRSQERARQRQQGTPTDQFGEAPAPPTETPHARRRKGRQSGVTWPSIRFKTEVQAQCKAWKMRLSDFVVLAVSRLMADILAGRVQRPPGKPDTDDRTNDWLDLPWDPG
jgi:hypothetical protein